MPRWPRPAGPRRPATGQYPPGTGEEATVTAPRACPVVACTGTAIGSFVIALLPSAGPGRCRTVTACPSCWRAVGNGATVHVEYTPGDTGRRSPRVLLGGARRVG